MSSIDTCSPPSEHPDLGFHLDLPRWQHLVSAHWLNELLAGKPVVAAPGTEWRLFEVACNGHDTFSAGHITSARYLDTGWFERLPFWNKVPDAELMRVLAKVDIGPDTTVILYGNNMLAAARVAHLMLVAGVQDVRLLDGGTTAWCAAGFAYHSGSSDVPTVIPDVAPLVRWTGRPDFLLNTEQARTLLDCSGCALVSIRTRAEYMGETSGYCYIQARGDIAGALWGHAGSEGDVNSMSCFQDALGRMKSADEITALWRAEGIRAGMQIAFYCGTGWRASMAFFYAWLMGWERISVYDGGWFEWSHDPANPTICRTAIT